MAISETKGQGWRAISTHWRKALLDSSAIQYTCMLPRYFRRDCPHPRFYCGNFVIFLPRYWFSRGLPLFCRGVISDTLSNSNIYDKIQPRVLYRVWHIEVDVTPGIKSRNFVTVTRLVFRTQQCWCILAQLCRENAVKVDWPILVHAIKFCRARKSCATKLHMTSVYKTPTVHAIQNPMHETHHQSHVWSRWGHNSIGHIYDFQIVFLYD